MHFTSAIILATASLAAAQSSSAPAAASSSSSSSSGCSSAIDSIIEACLGSVQPQLDACKTNDWDCMCTQATNVLTCYDYCPSDPRAFGIESQRTSWCDAAEQYSTSSTAAGGAGGGRATVVTPATSASSSPTGNGIQTGFASVSGSGVPASSTGGATAWPTPAAGMAAALFGLMVL